MPKHVIILGRGRGWSLAPVDDVESWGTCELFGRRKYDRLFDIHIGAPTERIAKIREAVKKTDTIYYTTDNYPLAEIMDFFKTDFFTNSICYAIALAIYEGYEKIDFYGLNQTHKWYREKCGIDYWCGQAEGRGIDVTVYGKYTNVMYTKDRLMYGYLTVQNLNKLKQSG